MIALAYTPFIDPLPAHGLWFILMIPIALGVAMAWKAVRIPDLPPPRPGAPARFPVRGFVLQTLFMSVQIVLGMIALGAASFLLVQYLVPALVP